MSAQAVEAMPGWYGKLPAIGDFASRRLPAAFIEPWDAWLQASLLASRASLGDRWLDHYLSAPIQRFVLGAEIIGESAWAGILMPSVDRVGRHFPLTIAVSLDRGGYDVSTMGGWFERIEAVGLRALDLTATLDAFDEGVCAASLATADMIDGLAPTPRQSRWWHSRSGALLDEHRFDGLPPAEAFATLLGAPPA